MNINLDNLKAQLDIEDIINIILHFYPNISYQETPFGLIFPTICHNADPTDGSMKLYYYDNTKLFHCYTQCQASFDIYELLNKIKINNNLELEFNSILQIIQNCSKVNLSYVNADELYTSKLLKYQRTRTKIEFTYYDPKILNLFPQCSPEPWVKDNIHSESMKRYNIRYSIAKNQIVIPHYNVDGILIGIRVRNFDEQNLINGKYMPLSVERKFYSHPLSLNLYGIHLNWHNLLTTKTAFIFEGEKSVLLCDGWYGENNIALATCGNKLSSFQLELLIKFGVQNIVLCYDRMNQEGYDDKYFNQLYSICREYKNYFNFSFIYDNEKILPYKAAPVDCGKAIFEYLLKKRVIIN